ncbi:sulfotransferase domain-containing protein [Crocosphaera sp. UHCC 0190]|uniref:sulfotransferase domain-containing protein n=1 Tax=Crocosphaera sp. UHCC 0190 TaxID=3110246 RepID=UPI002B1FDC8D|nr:sulfotransferase domain-containing protein [Crocosphaera sp. UHCC 0190]MEA5510198.1 sulfotransferase domain-containing protein [Crocosphaera sp. UHCC 0190]
MLIICCGMMRSGSTLQYQLTLAILEKTNKGTGLGEIRDGDCQQLLQTQSDDQMQVLKVHQFRHLKGVETAITQGQAKGIYTYRDIRDVTASLMKMRKATFEKLMFHTREIEECIRDFYHWTNLDHLLISRYEIMVNDLTQEALRIADHLNINLSQQEAQVIADEYSIERQKSRISSWKNNQVNDSKFYDPKSLLHANHIDSGKLNKWVNTLTPLQVAYLETTAKDWLISQNYPLSQPLFMDWLSQVVYAKYGIAKKINRIKAIK